MAVYYYKLFEKISELGISQKELIHRIGSSSSTIAKLRKNQEVSLDVLVRICDELKCDFGDIMSCYPGENINETISSDNPDYINSVYREKLMDYMENEHKSARNISELTGLSLNTVKSFLRGNNVSSVSRMKFLSLGQGFMDSIDAMLPSGPKSYIYCYSCGKRNNRCWGAHRVWNAITKTFDEYCAFGFSQGIDENGKIFALEECPHPTTGKEFSQVCEKYKYELKGEYEYIPTKSEE